MDGDQECVVAVNFILALWYGIMAGWRVSCGECIKKWFGMRFLLGFFSDMSILDFIGAYKTETRKEVY